MPGPHRRVFAGVDAALAHLFRHPAKGILPALAGHPFPAAVVVLATLKGLQDGRMLKGVEAHVFHFLFELSLSG